MLTPSSGSMRLLPWFILCVIAPTGILGLTARVLTERPPWAPSPLVALMDAQLAAQPVEVLTLGPSIARTDVDGATLGAGLRSPPLSVARLSQPLAPAPTWYAILRERVYAAGLRPKLVILVVTMDTLLTDRPRDAQLPQLTQHFAEPDAVLRRKALNSPWPAAVQRALESRETLRSGLLTWFRDAPAGAVFGTGAQGGAALVTRASERSLGEHHQALDEGATPASHLTQPDRSFLPDLAALVQAHGGRLAVVLPPASTRRSAGFRIDPQLERDTLLLANQLGVAWVDLRDWTDRDGDFRDGLHLSVEAAPRFTAAMAARLTAANALGPRAPVPAVEPPPVPTRSRIGTPPTLSAGAAVAGIGACDATCEVPEFAAFGDDRLRSVAPGLTSPLRVLEAGVPLARGAVRSGTCAARFSQRGGTLAVSTSQPRSALSVEVDPASSWIWPGGALSWSYDAGWAGAEDAVVEAEIVVVGDAGGAPPVLRIGDRMVSFSEGGKRRTLRVPAGGAAWSAITVIAPSPGAWVAVRSLSVSLGNASSVLVKPPAGRRTDLVSGAQFAPNPAPPLALGAFAGGPRNRRVAAPWPDHSLCSPVRVLENGTLLPGIPSAGSWIGVSPVDGSDPAKNGRSYTLALADDRRCVGAARSFAVSRIWMYPGDHFVATLSLPRSGASLDTLRAQAVPTEASPNGTLQLTLRAQEEARFDATLPLSGIALETPLPLTRSIPSGETIEVEATLSADAAPVLLSWFGLEE